MRRGLIWATTLTFGAAAAQAETVAEAHCGMEREQVRLTPGPHRNVDILQITLDRAETEEFSLAEGVSWPFSDSYYRQRAYIVVAASYVGHFPAFLKLAIEVADGQATADDLITYARNIQAIRAFEDCLKLSPAENLELFGSTEDLLSRTGACKQERDQGVDATVAYVLSTDNYSTVNDFAVETLAPFADCSEASTQK